MRYLAVDYGKKFIGLAISDAEGKVAFPYSILKNDNTFNESLLDIFAKEGVEAVVFGLSLDLSGEENKINEAIKNLAKKIEIENGLPILFENEIYSSMQAKRGLYKHQKPNSKIGREMSFKKEDRIDDKAATIVLQSFLDKM